MKPRHSLHYCIIFAAAWPTMAQDPAECSLAELSQASELFSRPEDLALVDSCTSQTEALQRADESRTGIEDLEALCDVEHCDKLVEIARDILPQIPNCLTNGTSLREHEAFDGVKSFVQVWERICLDSKAEVPSDDSTSDADSGSSSSNAASATTGLGPVLGFVLAACALGFAI